MTPVQVVLLRMNIYACVDVPSEKLSMSVCQNVAVFQEWPLFTHLTVFYYVVSDPEKNWETKYVR